MSILEIFLLAIAAAMSGGGMTLLAARQRNRRVAVSRPASRREPKAEVPRPTPVQAARAPDPEPPEAGAGPARPLRLEAPEAEPVEAVDREAVMKALSILAEGQAVLISGLDALAAGNADEVTDAVAILGETLSTRIDALEGGISARLTALEKALQRERLSKLEDKVEALSTDLAAQLDEANGRAKAQLDKRLAAAEKTIAARVAAAIDEAAQPEDDLQATLSQGLAGVGRRIDRLTALLPALLPSPSSMPSPARSATTLQMPNQAAAGSEGEEAAPEEDELKQPAAEAPQPSPAGAEAAAEAYEAGAAATETPTVATTATAPKFAVVSGGDEAEDDDAAASHPPPVPEHVESPLERARRELAMMRTRETLTGLLKTSGQGQGT